MMAGDCWGSPCCSPVTGMTPTIWSRGHYCDRLAAGLWPVGGRRDTRGRRSW